MSRNSIIILLLIALAVSLFSQDKVILVKVPKTLSSIPVMEMDGEMIGKSGIKVDFFDDHIMVMAEFVSGRLPVLMTGFSLGLANYHSGKETILLTAPVWGVNSLLTKNPGLKKLSDFTGKTILVPFAGSPLDVQLTAILKREGLLNKIKIDFSPIQQQPAMLIAGKADGICLPEPLASKLIYEKKASPVFVFAEKWNELNRINSGLPEVGIFVKKEWARQNSALLKSFVISLKSKIDAIKNNPDRILKKYKEIFNLDQAVIENGLKNVIFRISDAKSQADNCRNYQKLIGDEKSIGDDFFFN